MLQCATWWARWNAGLVVGLSSALTLGACASPPPRVVDEVENVVITQYSEGDSAELWRAPEHEIAIGVGASFWNKLPGHGPKRGFPTVRDFGKLQSWGVGFAASYHHKIAEWESATWWLGGELGVFSHDERSGFDVTLPVGEVIDDEVFADIGRLTASTKISVPVGKARFALGGGAGLLRALDSRRS